MATRGAGALPAAGIGATGEFVTNKNSGNTTLSSFSYGYNDDNTRSGCTESNGDTVSYSYDAAHRLTGESRSGGNGYSASYTLDGVGNRTSQTIGGTTTSFTLNSDDELTATSGGFTNAYSYNANGEQTGRTLSGTAYTLSYDYDGRLTQIAQGGTTVSFAYDALGRRYSRTAGGTTTVFQSAGSQVLLEKQGGTTTATYTYGSALIRKDSEVPLYDGLGSSRTVTNGSQTVIASAIYEGFGQTVASSGSSTSAYGFAGTSGYRTDGDAGLMHVGARYYDAQVGRFVTRDTVLTEHPYLYCDHDPVNAVDPSGHFKSDPYLAPAALGCAGAGALVGGGAVAAAPALGVIVVGAGAYALGIAAWAAGERLADELAPMPEKDYWAPAPSPGDMDRYRQEIIEGRMRGEIRMPVGGRWSRERPDAPVMRRVY